MKVLPVILLVIITVISLGNIARVEDTCYKDTRRDDNGRLYDTLARMDSILFHAFNSCEYDVFNDLLSKDLEFYHDKSGLTDYNYNITALKNKCKLAWKIRRELVPGSMEVYAVPGYGAIQVGSHRFYNTEKGPEMLGGTFKFLHIWKRENGKWRITRIASYDH